jgi:tryptophan synthase alpha chain
MGRIGTAFTRLKKEKRKALVIFITAGDPDIETTVKLVKAASGAGADIVELGVPFSDPLADGPVIQASFHRAIHGGTNVARVIEAVKKIRKDCQVPIVFMLASTLVINHGVKRFMKECATAGVDGLIIPDAPVDEAGEFVPSAKAVGLDTILLAAPTSTGARLKKIADMSSGFVYYISVTGVTGNKKATAGEVSAGVRKIKRLTRLPVLAGFGVTEPAQAREVSRRADGVIIGSQAIRVINSAKSKSKAVENLSEFVFSVREAMDKS